MKKDSPCTYTYAWVNTGYPKKPKVESVGSVVVLLRHCIDITGFLGKASLGEIVYSKDFDQVLKPCQNLACL